MTKYVKEILTEAGKSSTSNHNIMAFNLEMISGVGPRAKQKKELLVKADADLKAAEALLLQATADQELAVRNGTAQKLKELNGSLMYKSAAVIDLAFSSLKTFLVWMVFTVGS